MADIPYSILMVIAAITWLLTFAAGLLAGAWFLWRRWSLRRWVRDFDAVLASEARQHEGGTGKAAIYDPRLFRRPRG